MQAPTAALGAVLALALLGPGVRAGVPSPRGSQGPPRGGGAPRASSPARVSVNGVRRYGRDDRDALVADAAMRRAAPAASSGSPSRLDEWLPTVTEGDRFAGRVRSVCGYGCFVELIPESVADPYDQEVFLQKTFDRPWRPIGLLHISSLSPERVSDVEAFVTAAVGPEGSRVVVSLKSTLFNAKKRIALQLVEVLQREDAWVSAPRAAAAARLPACLAHPTCPRARALAAGGAAPQVGRARGRGRRARRAGERERGCQSRELGGRGAGAPAARAHLPHRPQLGTAPRRVAAGPRQARRDLAARRRGARRGGGGGPGRGPGGGARPQEGGHLPQLLTERLPRRVLCRGRALSWLGCGSLETVDIEGAAAARGRSSLCRALASRHRSPLRAEALSLREIWCAAAGRSAADQCECRTCLVSGSPGA